MSAVSRTSQVIWTNSETGEEISDDVIKKAGEVMGIVIGDSICQGDFTGFQKLLPAYISLVTNSSEQALCNIVSEQIFPRLFKKDGHFLDRDLMMTSAIEIACEKKIYGLINRCTAYLLRSEDELIAQKISNYVKKLYQSGCFDKRFNEVVTQYKKDIIQNYSPNRQLLCNLFPFNLAQKVAREDQKEPI